MKKHSVKSVRIIDDNTDIADSMVEGMDMFGIKVAGKTHNGLEQFKKNQTLCY